MSQTGFQVGIDTNLYQFGGVGVQIVDYKLVSQVGIDTQLVDFSALNCQF